MGEIISQIAASVIITYTIIAPAVRGPWKIQPTRLKSNIPYNHQFTAPSSTRI